MLLNTEGKKKQNKKTQLKNKIHVHGFDFFLRWAKLRIIIVTVNPGTKPNFNREGAPPATHLRKSYIFLLQ